MRRRAVAERGRALNATLPFGWRLRGAVAVALVPPLIEVMSFARVEKWLLRAAQIRVGRAPEDADAARWVDRQLMRLPNPWAHSCLRRAAVLYYLLQADGRAVALCIGVRRDPDGTLHAHAWLVRDGKPYLESARGGERVADFDEIARFPQHAPHSAQDAKQ